MQGNTAINQAAMTNEGQVGAAPSSLVFMGHITGGRAVRNMMMLQIMKSSRLGKLGIICLAPK